MTDRNRIAVLSFLTGLITVLAATTGAGAASAAGETATIETAVVPQAGKLYKEKAVPANMSLSVQINTPTSSPTVLPLKRAKIQFPTDLTYNPNNRRTPVCKDSVLNEQSDLAAGTAEVVSHCPKSVIGTGTADIYLGKNHQPNYLITDPELVIFNAGRDRHGNAKMKIYGYSDTTHYGVLMRGTLTPRGIEDVAIPVLSADSATASFVLSIPGGGLDVGGQTIKGLDPAYARIRCSSESWTTEGEFTLGERSFPSGTDIGPETVIGAPPFTSQCHGLRGRAKLTKARAKGPKRLRRGARKAFRVKVRNAGTATARKIRIEARGSGRGRAKMANLKPGKSRALRVRVRITGRKGSRAKIVFRISAKGTATRAVARGRILR